MCKPRLRAEMKGTKNINIHPDEAGVIDFLQIAIVELVAIPGSPLTNDIKLLEALADEGCTPGPLQFLPP